jgi:hypothetical protein
MPPRVRQNAVDRRTKKPYVKCNYNNIPSLSTVKTSTIKGRIWRCQKYAVEYLKSRGLFDPENPPKYTSAHVNNLNRCECKVPDDDSKAPKKKFYGPFELCRNKAMFPGINRCYKHFLYF